MLFRVFNCVVMNSHGSRVNCCVVGCSSNYKNSPGTKFYGFPTKPWDRERREEWIRLVRRKNDDGTDWRPSKGSKIGSKHFVNNAKANEEKHPGYNPSIFPSPYKRKQSGGSYERYERQRRRSTKRARPEQKTLDYAEDSVPATAHDLAVIPDDETQFSESATVDASTMTAEPSLCCAGTFIFVSTTFDGNASCYVSHSTVSCVDRETSCDIEFAEKSVGPLLGCAVYARLRYAPRRHFAELTAHKLPHVVHMSGFEKEYPFS